MSDLPSESEYVCPRCDGRIESGSDSSTPAECPHCGEEIRIVGMGSVDSFHVIDDSEPPAVPAEETLDRKRIAFLTRQKVSTLRSRRIAIVWSVACAFGAAAFGKTAYESWDLSRRWAYVLLVIALGCAYHAFDFWQQFVRLNREIKTAPPEPALPPPDFSTLSDGRQQAKNLEDVR